MNVLNLFKAKYPSNIQRTDPSISYNCHGMTFAARRVWIESAYEVQKILADDQYQLIVRKDVLPGDTVVYFSDAEPRSPTHSGIVVEVTSTFPQSIRVCSKWGHSSEWIHWVEQSEYGTNYAFYRVRR